MGVFDLLDDTSKSLSKHGPTDFGVTSEQHSDLIEWCRRLISRRAELKAAMGELIAEHALEGDAEDRTVIFRLRHGGICHHFSSHYGTIRAI